MVASHEIFRAPFAVTPTMQDIKTPEHYRRYPEGEGLGATMPGWTVCASKADYPGVVADGYGFEDSPDCEFIASGVNSKGPRAAALARQGNFFQWGFAASPKGMSEEARTVFLNTIAYMRRFDGQTPLVQDVGRARDWLAVMARHIGTSSDSYARKQIPGEILAEAGDDVDKVKAVLARDRGYLAFTDGKFVLDADCKALGLANHNAKLLPTCVALLREEKDSERALRVLHRYTDQEFTRAQDWEKWLAETEGRRFFSDRGGCRWFVAPAREKERQGG